jgi:hypothetical protein
MSNLSQKDIRTIKIGVVCIVAILAFTLGAKWLDHWAGVRESLTRTRASLNDVADQQSKQAGLLSVVPVFEMPQTEEKQELLFRDKLNEQLKKARIDSEPLQIQPTRKAKQAIVGYKVLSVKFKAKCRFEQLLDLLTNLKENPYLVGVDELKITCDTKQSPEKRQDLTVEMMVSTLVK